MEKSQSGWWEDNLNMGIDTKKNPLSLVGRQFGYGNGHKEESPLIAKY
jgi:hypothetical protein